MKDQNKPEWLLKAEQERDKFNETKWAKYNNRQFNAALNLQNIKYETRLVMGKIIAQIKKERGTDKIAVKKSKLTKIKNGTTGKTNGKKMVETKRATGSLESGANKTRKITKELANEIRSKYIPKIFLSSISNPHYIKYNTCND